MERDAFCSSGKQVGVARTLEIDPLILKTFSQQRITLDQKKLFASVVPNEVDEHGPGAIIPVQYGMGAPRGILVSDPRHCGVFRRALLLAVLRVSKAAC